MRQILVARGQLLHEPESVLKPSETVEDLRIPRNLDYSPNSDYLFYEQGSVLFAISNGRLKGRGYYIWQPYTTGLCEPAKAGEQSSKLFRQTMCEALASFTYKTAKAIR